MAVYRRWDDGFVIRRMRRGEEQLVIEWFGEIEPMSSDLQVAMAMRHGDDDDDDDGSGFYAGELNGEMVASLVQTRIAHDLLYVSCVYVAAPHRRSGFAQRMISTAEDLGPQRHWTTAGSVVLDAYDHLRSMYQRFGYIAAFKVTTYHGTVSTNADRDGFRADIKEVEVLGLILQSLCFIFPFYYYQHSIYWPPAMMAAVFTARRYAKRRPVSVRPSVWRLYCIPTAEDIVKLLCRLGSPSF